MLFVDAAQEGSFTGEYTTYFCAVIRKSSSYLELWSFLDGFLKNLSFKIAMSGRAGGHLASSEVYLLVNLFSKLYVTFILQWIAFIFGRDEEEDQ